MIAKKTLLALLILFLTPCFARGEEKISVKDPWVRQNPPGTSVTAAYMVMENLTASTEELVRVSCSCSSEASLHLTETRDGSMTMKKVASIEIPPGASLALAPGGYHVMLTGLSDDIGKTAVLELQFRSGMRISVKASVLDPRDAKKREGHHHH